MGQNFKVKQEISKDKLSHDTGSARGLASVAKHEVIRESHLCLPYCKVLATYLYYCCMVQKNHNVKNNIFLNNCGNSTLADRLHIL